LKLLAVIASLFIRALNATLRVRHVRVENLQNAPQHILACWHSHLLLMLHSRWRAPIAVMISRSKDGEIIRASSSRTAASTRRAGPRRAAVARTARAAA
jgi:lysophospholipid acyltransferase (LPLAT)-like uncharacterized protein